MIKKWRATLYTSLMGSLLGVALLVTGLAHAQCPDGITSLWALDELNGDIYSDSVDPVNDGAGAVSPTAVVGIVDGAQLFDGAATGINVGADVSFNWAFNDSFSIEYWIRRTNDAFDDPAEVVVGRDDSATSLHWWAGLWDDGTAAFVLIATDGTGFGTRDGGELLEGDADLRDGEWHHVAVVRDFATTENRLYVDGILNDTADIAYEDGFGFDSAAAMLNMGWLNVGVNFRYNGTMDEVAIYDRVLTAAEILQHFNDKVSYCADDDDDDNGGGGGGGGGGGSSCFIESLR